MKKPLQITSLSIPAINAILIALQKKTSISLEKLQAEINELKSESSNNFLEDR